MKASKFFLTTLFAAAAMTASVYAETYTVTGAVKAEGTTSVKPNGGTITDSSGASVANATITANDTYRFNGAIGYLTGWDNGNFAPNIVLMEDSNGTAAFTWNDGSSTSEKTITFLGKVSGTGTFKKQTTASNKRQSYTFAGNLSDFSGDFINTESGVASRLSFGNGGSAASTSDISGTGKIEWLAQPVVFNYSSGELSVGNESISTASLEFKGGADYTVSSALNGYNISPANNALSISAGTTTFEGDISKFGSIRISADTTAVFASKVSLSSAIQSEGTVRFDESAIFELDGLTATDGVYTVISGGSVSGGLSYSNFSFAGTTLSDRAIISTENNAVTVTLTSLNLTWNGAEDNNRWTTASDVKNWRSEAGVSVSFSNLDSVIFAEGGYSTVVVDNALSVVALSVLGDYTLSLSGTGSKIAASTLSIADGKKLTLSGDGSFTAQQISETGALLLDGVSLELSSEAAAVLNSLEVGAQGGKLTAKGDLTIRSLSMQEGATLVKSGEKNLFLSSGVELGTGRRLEMEGGLLQIGVGDKVSTKGAGTIALKDGTSLVLYGGGDHHKLAQNIETQGNVALNTHDGSQAGSDSYQYELTGNISVGTGTLTIATDSNNWAKEVALKGNLSGAGTVHFYRGSGDGAYNSNGRLIVAGSNNSGFTGTLFVEAKNNYSIGLDLIGSLENATLKLSGTSGGQEAYVRVLGNVAVKRLEGNAGVQIGAADTLQGGVVGNYTLTVSEGDYAGKLYNYGVARQYGSTSKVSVTSGSLTLKKISDGDLTLSGDVNLKGITVEAGTLSLTNSTGATVGELLQNGGTVSASGNLTASTSLKQEGGALSVGGTLNVGDLNLAGASASFVGNATATTAVVGAASTEFKGDLTVAETLTVQRGATTVGGTLDATDIHVSGGSLSVTKLASHDALNIEVSGGELDLNETTKSVAGVFSIDLSGGKLADLSLVGATAGTVLELKGGELSNASLNAGTESLVFYADMDAGEEGDYLNSAPALTISDGFVLNSTATVDLSNLVFEKAEDKYALINIGDGVSGENVAGLFNAVSGLDGEFLYDSVNNWVAFQAGEGMSFSLTWDNTNPNKNWKDTLLQGASYPNLGDRSLYFGKLQDATAETVLIGTGAGAQTVTIAGGSSDVYTFTTEGSVENFGIGKLQVRRGTLDVDVAMLVETGITLSGGTLIGSVQNALNVGTGAAIEVIGGTLSLQRANATNAKTINLGAGATLELTATGAISELAKENGGEFVLNVSGTEDEHATITWNGATDSFAANTKIATGSYVDFNVLSGEVEWKEGLSSDVADVSYYKTGAGTFFLNAPTALTGSFYVNEGVLALGRGSDGKGIFAGDITVSGSNAVLRLEDAYSFGAASGSDTSANLVITDGAKMELFGGRVGADDTQRLTNISITLGDGASIGNIEGETANNNGIVLDSNSPVTVDDGATAKIAVTVQLESASTVEFNVGGGAELTLSEGVIDRVNETASASLTKSGAGTLVLSGDSDLNNAKVYSGGTLIDEGTLRFSGATPGSGEIQIADGAIMEVNSTRTTQFSGNVNGKDGGVSGSIYVVAGTAKFSGAVNVASTSIDSGARVLVENSYASALRLGGIIGGNGSFEGDVDIDLGAKIFADEEQTFVFKATSLKGVEALTKSGDGAVVLDSALTSGFDLTLEAGTLESKANQSINALIFSGGTLSATADADAENPPKWTLNELAVNAAGGTILTGVELTSLTGKSSLALGGSLLIGGNSGLLKSTSDTLALSADRNGALTIATRVEEEDATGNVTVSYLAGGKLEAEHLEVDASLNRIQMGENEDVDAEVEHSEIVVNNAVFNGDISILGTAGKISVAESIVFKGGDAGSSIAGILESTGTENAVVDVEKGSVSVGILSGKITKLGSGTLNLGNDSVFRLDALEIREGRVSLPTTYTSLIDTPLEILVSGAGSELTVAGLSGVDVTLENKATYTGNLSVTAYGRRTSLTNSRINGDLNFISGASRVIEGSEVTIGNMIVSGTVSFGEYGWPTEIEEGDKIAPSPMSGVITILGNTTAITADVLELYGEKGLSLDNFELEHSAIGSELTIVGFNTLKYYTESAVVESAGEGFFSWMIPDPTKVDFNEIGGYILLGSELIGGREFHLVLEEKALKVVADGTLLWNGAEEWNSTDFGWKMKFLDGDQENQKFTAGDYVDFEFAGSTNAISVKETVNVSGVVFGGDSENSTFTLNFDGGQIADYVSGGDETTAAAVTIKSGQVIFNDTTNGNASNTFSGDLTILEGATLSANNTKLLGTGDVLLSGGFKFTGTATNSQFDNNLVVSGSSATVSVENASAGLTLSGTLSGTQLTKLGSGTLTIAGNASLEALVINQGAVKIESATTAETGILSFDVTAGASKEGLTFGENSSLGMFADLSVAAGKQVTFKGNSTWLNSVLLKGTNANVSVVGGESSNFKVGGAYETEDGTSVVWATIEKTDENAATLSGNMVLQGGATGEETAGLTVNVADKNGILKISGNVKDGADAGKFAFEKTGAGTLEIGGSFKTAGLVSVDGGTLAVGGAANLTGTVQVLSDAVFDFGKGGTIGNKESIGSKESKKSYLIVQGDLTLKTGGNFTLYGELVATGDLTFETSRGGRISFAGEKNTFSNIELSETSTLKIDDSVTEFIGEKIVLGAESTLEVLGTLTGSSGILEFSPGAKIDLSGGTIRFSGITGTYNREFEILGNGEVIVSGSVGTNNTTKLSSSVKLTVDSDANVQIGKLTGTGTVTKKGKGKLTVSTGAKSDASFTGKFVADAGTVSITNGSLGLAELTVNEGAEVVLTRSAIIGGWVIDQTVAGSLVGGSGTVAIENAGKTLQFSKAIGDAFTGTLEARNAGTLIYNQFSAGEERNVALTNGGLLKVATTGDAETLAMGNLAVSGKSNLVTLAAGKTLAIGSMTIVDAKNASDLTFAGDGDATIAGTIAKSPSSRALFDISTGADFTGTLTLSGENNAHRDTIINSGTVVFKSNVSSAGTGKIVLNSLENATVRFDDFAADEILDTKISGTGTVEGTSGTLSGLTDEFQGVVRAVKGSGESSVFTVDKSGWDMLSESNLTFAAGEGATLVVRTDGVGSELLDTIEMGNATFGDGAGTIRLALGTVQTLEVENANACAGTLEVASGTLKVTGAGNLGTATVNILSGAKLSLASTALLSREIKGEGTLVKNTSGTSYVDGIINAATEVSVGALAVSQFGENAKVHVRNGTVELSKTLDENGNVVNRAEGSKSFDAAYSGEGAVRFSHEAANASSVVDGTFAWKEGAAGTLILSGGGEGSRIDFELKGGNVTKSGSGKWTLANFSDIDTFMLETGGGTLALENYVGEDKQSFVLGSDAVLEIAGFDTSADDAVVRGKVSGDGTLAVSATGGDVSFALDANSGTEWSLQVRKGASVVVSDAGELIAASIEVQSNPEDRKRGGSLTFETGGATFAFENRLFTIGGINRDVAEIRNGSLVVRGGGTLDLTQSTLKLGGILDIENGVVKVASVGRITPTAGVVNIRSGGTLEIGLAGSAGEISALAGSGKVDFVAGTTTLKNINMAQSPSEFNANFTGTVAVRDGATVVLDSGATFGNVSRVEVSGSLKVSQNSETTLKNLAGAGTLEIANTGASVKTVYGDNSAFTGKINITTGRLEMAPSVFDGLSNEVSLGENAASGLALSNASATVAELSELAGKQNISGNGSIFLSASESGFSIAAGKAFGYGSGLYVDAASALAMGRGATVSGNLYVAKGATLDLTQSVAASTAARSASSASGNATRNVAGNFTLAGSLKTLVPSGDSAAIHAAGTATIEKTATVEVGGDSASDGAFTLVVSDTKGGFIENGALFQTASGERLTARVSDDASKIIVSFNALSVAGSVPSGLEKLNDTILTNTDSEIYKAIYWSGTDAEQYARLANFSPISFAGALELSTGLTQFENDLLRQRLEQRRYDRAFSEPAGTIKAYANTIGSSTETSEGEEKSANYDLSHYGAIAGFDVSVTEDFQLGVSFTYDFGKAKVHGNGGEHETDTARVNVYGMAMLDEVSYFGFGVGLGITGLETSRRNELETLSGDTSGTDVSLTATLGRMFVLAPQAGLHFSPYIGLDYTFSRFGGFEETGGSQTALEVDDLERNSLRGIVGATLNWLPSEDWRFSLEAAFRHEFLDTDTDIDAKFIGGTYAGMSASSTAYFNGENSVSVGPRVEYRINANWSVSAGYTFESDFDNATTHSGNVGVRCKF